MQSTHSIADFAHEFPAEFKQWKDESNSIICLSANSHEHLVKLYERYRGLTPTVMFYEPDISAETSLCLYGTPNVRKKLSNLSLLLK